MKNGLGDLKQTIQELKGKKIELGKDLINIETALNGGDVIIKMNEGELGKLEKDKKNNENELAKARRNYNIGSSRFNRYNKKLNEIEQTDNYYKISDADIKQYESKKRQGKYAMRKYAPIIARLKKDIISINNKIGIADSEKGEREGSLKEEYKATKEKIKIEKEQIDVEIADMEARLAAKDQEADDTSIQFDGLMARLIAMDRLSYDIDTIYKSVAINYSDMDTDSLGMDLICQSRVKVHI